MEHKIPFDMAFQLDDVTRAGWCIIFSELGGAKFNWDRLEFEKDRE